ncbi:MAG: DUF805 domain-containing protein [Pseudomonadota bacterium]
MIDEIDSLRGRTGRAGFWSEVIIAVIVFLGLYLLAASTIFSIFSSDRVPALELQSYWALRSVQFASSILATLIISFVMLARLHDRGKSAWPWLLIPILPGLMLSTIALFQIGFLEVSVSETLPIDLSPEHIAELGLDVDAVMLVPNDVLIVPLQFLGAITSIWYLIELGFLKGQSGSNMYGPDPRGPQT